MIESAKQIEVHCCDSCTIRAKIVPKTPADSGTKSWYCHVCGHFGIGSMTVCKEGDWLSLVPIRQSLAIQDVGEHNPAERIKQLETALRHAADEPNIDRALAIDDTGLSTESLADTLHDCAHKDTGKARAAVSFRKQEGGK